MKTVFKVGQKVYDQVNFPDKEGKVEEIYISEEEEYPIVSFGKRERICYSSDGRLSGCITKMLSTKPYKIEFQGFEQKAPVPTFEEAWKKTMRLYEPKSEYNKEEYKGYPSQELADASEALRRLLFLRDYYNEGWQPNWKSIDFKYCIQVYKGGIETMNYNTIYKVMYFKTPEIRDKFLEEQKELLETAKPLL